MEYYGNGLIGSIPSQMLNDYVHFVIHTIIAKNTLSDFEIQKKMSVLNIQL